MRSFDKRRHVAGGFGIAVVFGLLEDQFLTSRNFTNLLLQMSPIAFFAIGIVFILLIADGEIVTIDLSVAFVAAVGGVVMTLLQRPDDPGWPWWACILGALVVTTSIGFVHSLISARNQPFELPRIGPALPRLPCAPWAATDKSAPVCP